MGALPKQRITRAKQGFRRQHDKLTPIALMTCPQCRQYKRQHHVCPSCGYYAGRQVLEIEVKRQRES
ncbi:MAG TPA: 50S ribosomal protein L32 [Thermomicrobiales bacterium]|jgi:large subunit ribosomal protein L32|nr:50S ribosomal protein L32 [Thermomicrobiales bacterium]